jgi:hypothetical protein
MNKFKSKHPTAISCETKRGNWIITKLTVPTKYNCQSYFQETYPKKRIQLCNWKIIPPLLE